jgi:hypothetical protein
MGGRPDHVQLHHLARVRRQQLPPRLQRAVVPAVAALRKFFDEVYYYEKRSVVVLHEKLQHAGPKWS